MIKPVLLLSAALMFTLGVTRAQQAVDVAPTDEASQAQTRSEGKGAPEIVPHRMNNPHHTVPTAGSTGSILPSIRYHGGPVMGTPNVYLIWYGNWNQSNGSDTPGGQAIIRDFLHGLSGSNYYVTNASYGTPSGSFVVKGQTTDSYSRGASLSDSAIQAIVTRAIGTLGKDTNGIYFVLTSSDVAETSGFCSQYCGWHTYGTISGSNIKYAFVGNANRCLSGCAAQTNGPNGNAGVDGMASVLAHELEEANTDPDLNAWFDSRGAEDADKCAWTFGSHQTRAANGAYYNMTLTGVSGNTRKFLIQRELDVNSKCYVDYVNKLQ